MSNTKDNELSTSNGEVTGDIPAVVDSKEDIKAEDAKAEESNEGADAVTQTEVKAEGAVDTSKEVEVEAKSVDVEKLKESFQEKAKMYLADQTQPVVIPSFAKWFDMNGIHQIEHKLFPDFFPSKQEIQAGAIRSQYKTPEVYRNIRDFIINAYRLNPVEYLTITAVRRNVSGDVASIIRIHQFLEKWGLINYQVDPRTKSSVTGPSYTGHFQVHLDSPKGLVPFVENAKQLKHKTSTVTTTTITESSQAKDKPSSITLDSKETIMPLNLALKTNVYATNEIEKSSPGVVQYFCNVCGKDSSSIRYHNLKSKTMGANSSVNNAHVLCETCFDQGLFPATFTSSDFIKMKDTQTTDSSVWNEQEILYLLEGIELFCSTDYNDSGSVPLVQENSNGQWDKISEHVGTKTREQCVLKFLQLPIEDRYLNKLLLKPKVANNSTSTNTELLIPKIAEELIKREEGKKLFEANGNAAKELAAQEQNELISQIILLTLDKVELKMKHVEAMEANMMKIHQQLDLERTQILMERVERSKKVAALKQAHPELGEELDDLLRPIELVEVRQVLNSLKFNKSNSMEVDETANGSKVDLNGIGMPVSVTQPKAYQFWSG